MTDQELMELAAKAVGIADMPYFGGAEGGGYCYYESERSTHKIYWDPLEDDGDALQLAVKLEIAINPYAGKTVVAHEDSRRLAHEKWDCSDDPCAATRRAIVRCAAEIGKAIP